MEKELIRVSIRVKGVFGLDGAETNEMFVGTEKDLLEPYVIDRVRLLTRIPAKDYKRIVRGFRNRRQIAVHRGVFEISKYDLPEDYG